jgi:dolichyl-phosphate-mannose-protein mannosyltransferase
MPGPHDQLLHEGRDPIAWCAVITAAFMALCWHHLGIPSKIYFDEVHYVHAARELLQLHRANPEHPILGKTLIAASIRLLGDYPLAWRLPSLLLGALGLFAFGRLVWWASLRRFAAIAAMLLLATNFLWFIQSRIAMLDMAMASFGMIALWQFAAALRMSGNAARTRLASCGLFLGLALGCKWSIAPAAMLPGLTVLVLRLRDHGRRFMRGSEGPAGGITLIEAALWLGAVPLAVYWMTFAPTFFLSDHPVPPWDIIGHHQYMFELQDSVRKPHPYRSVWYQWIINWRAIWYLYEHVDGVQRGIVLIGNPFTMLAGLAGLGWCLWAAIRRRRSDALAFALLYLASIGLWIVTQKPVQFYYHYILPGAFLMACLALALDALWQRRDRWRWGAPCAIALSFGMFAWFYPIISAAPLHHGKKSYAEWMWLASWR